MVEMTIHSIRVTEAHHQGVVILKQKQSNRYLAIWIGQAEVSAIAMKFQNVELGRPLTHDLLQSVILALGAGPDYVVVCDMQNDTFYAKLALTAEGREIEVDCRPSDALALAVRAEVPIYADDAVLAKAGIVLDEDTGEPLKEHQTAERDSEKLSAFKDFISDLDLHDFEQQDS